jgi:hypothetical protein
LVVLGATNGVVKMTTSSEPQAEDWPAIYQHITETGQFEFLHKRLTATTVKEHVDAGETIPGVIFVDTYKLSVSKL